MRFLIRDILLATFFIAIAALYISSHWKSQLLRARLLSKEQEFSAEYNKNVLLAPDRDFVQANIDRAVQTEDLAQQIEKHFPAFKAKYATVEPKGPTTVSVRQIPMLRDRKTGKDLSRIRIYIPAERALYLKFGITTRKSLGLRETVSMESNQSVSPKSETRWETRIDYHDDGFTDRETLESKTNYERGTTFESITEYSESGPFECRLQSGLVDFDWSCEINSQGLWKIQLLMNQQSLLTTILQVKEKFNSCSSLISKEQLDFNPGMSLPELFTSKRFQSPLGPQTPSYNQIHVWLDDVSSGFGAFPGALDPK